MSATVTLPCKPRTATGKSAARRLRKEGQIPVILYGGEQGATALSMESRVLIDFLRHHPRNTIADLDVEGTTRTAVIKDLTVHPVSHRMIHLDLLEISADRPITLDIPIVVTGEDPIGVRHGGVLQVVRDRLRVRCLPGEVPESIEVDLSSMDADEALTVADLKIAVKIIAPPDTVLFKVLSPRVAAAAMAALEASITEEAKVEGEGDEEAKEETEA